MWKQLFQVKACAFVSELVFQVDDGASSVVVPLVRPDVRLVLSFGLQGLPVGRATLRKTCRNVLSIDDVALCVCMCARRTSLMMSIKGRSFGCSEEAELKICCPGFGGPTATSVPRSRAAAEEFALGGNGTCNCQAGFAGSACEDCEAGRYGATRNSGSASWPLRNLGPFAVFVPTDEGFKGKAGLAINDL
ncbi:stabilin-2 isoform X5 [Phycodurus eques]|uniref:stabilin-2 isoform X5 n=1 Tax=Phycodurus eques TaxID=693459 RepID=UPI002ACD3676|nr:stabilin-2 isoform X5 [Phycodurus eques]